VSESGRETVLERGLEPGLEHGFERDTGIPTYVGRRALVEPVDDRLADVPLDAWFDRLRSEQPSGGRGWAARIVAAPRAVVAGVGLLVVALTSMAFFAVLGLLVGG
jgi:hypothetical protein